jgi:hypothetical protein
MYNDGDIVSPLGTSGVAPCLVAPAFLISPIVTFAATNVPAACCTTHQHCCLRTTTCRTCRHGRANRRQHRGHEGLRPGLTDVTWVSRSLLAALSKQAIPRLNVPGKDDHSLFPGTYLLKHASSFTSQMPNLSLPKSRVGSDPPSSGDPSSTPASSTVQPITAQKAMH